MIQISKRLKYNPINLFNMNISGQLIHNMFNTTHKSTYLKTHTLKCSFYLLHFVNIVLLCWSNNLKFQINHILTDTICAIFWVFSICGRAGWGEEVSSFNTRGLVCHGERHWENFITNITLWHYGTMTLWHYGNMTL